MYRDNNNYILDSYFGIGILNRFAFILDYSRYTSFNVLTSILRVIPKRGFHLLISYDFSDENNEKMRLGGGFSIFYNPYLEIMSFTSHWILKINQIYQRSQSISFSSFYNNHHHNVQIFYNPLPNPFQFLLFCA